MRNSETPSWHFFKSFLGFKNKRGHQDAKNLEEWTRIFNDVGFDVINVFPDQYPLVKKLKRRNLWLKKVNYKQLLSSNQPIESANEFLFLLKKS